MIALRPVVEDDPFESNAASVAVLRKCGFAETGRETGPEGTQVLLVLEH